MAKKKERLDNMLVQRQLVPTRAKAKGMILAGEVMVNGVRVDKAGTAVSVDAEITLKAKLPYVGRGGLKLAGALDVFPIEVVGKICADVGACTGGFTDVLLQRDAARVYALDVGYGQLDWRLRQDERVTVMERTNARYVEALDEQVQFVCIDVSFISLKLILPAVKLWLDSAQSTDVVALIKPQFEAGRKQVGKGGIVKDTAVHKQVLLDILSWSTENDLAPLGLIASPVTGSDGNLEFLVWLRLGDEQVVGETAVDAVLNSI
ncbi:MAG: TlyA family RNA methyltransferase [Chloroflexi bacterium]|nr:TlyA family RNA methyltransferase [Chloroflexota bacterium]